MTEIPEFPLAEGLAELTAMLDRLDVFAFEFPDKDAAGDCYERGMARVGERMKARADEDVTVGATLWRASDRAGVRWFVDVVDDGLGLRDSADLWIGGTPYELGQQPGMREALVERHVAKILNAPGRERRTETHYPRGAELGRGGILAARIGRDQ